MKKRPTSQDPLARAYALLSQVDDLAAEDDDLEPGDPDADLILAAYFGDVKKAKRALDSGASADARQTGTKQPAIWLAVSNDHLEIVRLLLARGADAKVIVKEKVGRRTVAYTPLERAEAEGKEPIAKLLRSYEQPRKKAAKSGKRSRTMRATT